MTNWADYEVVTVASIVMKSDKLTDETLLET